MRTIEVDERAAKRRRRPSGRSRHIWRIEYAESEHIQREFPQRVASPLRNDGGRGGGFTPSRRRRCCWRPLSAEFCAAISLRALRYGANNDAGRRQRMN